MKVCGKLCKSEEKPMKSRQQSPPWFLSSKVRFAVDALVLRKRHLPSIELRDVNFMFLKGHKKEVRLLAAVNMLLHFVHYTQCMLHSGFWVCLAAWGFGIAVFPC